MTIHTALVCGKWKLPVLEGKAEMVIGGARSYYAFINGRSKEIGRNVQCIEDLITHLPPGIETVIEPFGGIGGFTTVIQQTIHPKLHTIFEINDDCLAQLKNGFDSNPTIVIRNEDSREIFGTIPADLYVLDIPSPSTLKSYPKWEKQWKQVISNQPKAIIWHDSASRYLHLHFETYSREAKHTITDHESYGVAMSKFMQERHGYSVHAMTYSQSAHYFLSRPGPPPEAIVYKRIVNGEAGFRWV